MDYQPLIHLEIHFPETIPYAPHGEIVMVENKESRHLVLKLSADQGLHLLERAFENDRIFRKDLEALRDDLIAGLQERKSLVGLTPALEEIGALPLTLFQLEEIFRGRTQ